MPKTVYSLTFLIVIAIIGMLLKYLRHQIEMKMEQQLIDIDIQTPYNPQTSYFVILKFDDKFIHEATLFNDLGEMLEHIECTFKSKNEAIKKLVKEHYKRKERYFVEIEKDVNKALGDKATVAEIKEKFSKTYEAYELNEIIKELEK